MPKPKKQPQFDIDEPEKKQAAQADLAQIQAYTKEMREIEGKLDYCAQVVAKLNERHNEIEMKLLPDCMATVGMEKFKLQSGETVEIKQIIRAAITTLNAIEKMEDGPDKTIKLENRNKALKFLRDNKAGDLIKNELTVNFGKGEDKKAKELLKLAAKYSSAVKLEESVHYQTLNSFIREAMTNGLEIPSEPFGLFIGKKAEIKVPKKPNTD